MEGRRSGSWWTGHVANPLLLRLLLGRLGARVGRRLAVGYRGRRTGRRHDLVVQYARDGTDRVWIVPGHPDRKRWWRNLVDPAPVDLWLAGREAHGTAVVTTERDEAFDHGFGTYLGTFPGAGRSGRPAVMVRVDLAPAAATGAARSPGGSEVEEEGEVER